MSTLNHQPQTTLVTGATSGFGKDIALRLARDGMKVDPTQNTRAHRRAGCHDGPPPRRRTGGDCRSRGIPRPLGDGWYGLWRSPDQVRQALAELDAVGRKLQFEASVRLLTHIARVHRAGRVSETAGALRRRNNNAHRAHERLKEQRRWHCLLAGFTTSPFAPRI